MATEQNKPGDDDVLLCAGCGQPIKSEPGGLNYAKIAKALGSDSFYHAQCHPKVRMMAEICRVKGA